MLRSFGSVLFLLLAACGGDVVASPGQSGDEASGSGAGGSGTTASGNTGAAATGSASGTTSTSGAGASPAACAGSLVEVIDSIENTKLTSICAQGWGAKSTSTPVGYYVSGGPAPGIHALTIEACSTALPGSASIKLGAENADVPGAYVGRAAFTDAQGGTWEELQPGTTKLTLDSIGPEGDVIEGSYFANLVNGEITQDVQGTFRVCHVEDENVP